MFLGQYRITTILSQDKTVLSQATFFRFRTDTALGQDCPGTCLTVYASVASDSLGQICPSAVDGSKFLPSQLKLTRDWNSHVPPIL
ncbi:hypothetical protein PoB_004629900 [Plakobranchus ocellatus]|uniref:Uncharacterized protein n=1 Tax=Plakobranchus ocellatus TaxID=259542 RepID=A0AAV4BLI5_9GAST|nr:hypothetical protein PoB_004629900 [Plakobranchus ocellatus]